MFDRASIDRSPIVEKVDPSHIRQPHSQRLCATLKHACVQGGYCPGFAQCCAIAVQTRASLCAVTLAFSFRCALVPSARSRSSVLALPSCLLDSSLIAVPTVPLRRLAPLLVVMRLLLVLALGLMLLCALSSCSAEEMGADMDAAAAAASSSRQWLQPVLLRHADSSDAREESLWDSVEPEYSDSSDDQEHTALLEETGTQVREHSTTLTEQRGVQVDGVCTQALTRLCSAVVYLSPQHTPRIMRSSQFKDYMKSIVVRGTHTNRPASELLDCRPRPTAADSRMALPRFCACRPVQRSS